MASGDVVETAKDMAAFIEAFKFLVPADQTVVAALVFKMASQEKQISTLAKAVMEKLPNG